MKNLVAVCLFILSALSHAQVLRYAELNITQIGKLDRAHTAIVVTNGILEEHGPYLPSFTDGYYNEAITKSLAASIAARPGWTAVLLPTIPLGTGGANEIGERWSFPGSVTLRQTTMREVFMDLADALGEQGFRYVFVIENHAAPANNRALDQASDYFHDTYHGEMVSLFGLMPIVACCDTLERTLTPEQVKANGLGLHADALEHSMTLSIRPDLVAPGYRTAKPQGGKDFAALMQIARTPGWPGYFGAPHFATRDIGDRFFAAQSAAVNKMALAVLDGSVDVRKLPRFGDILYGMTGPVQQAAAAQEAQAGERHRAWLAAHPARD